MSLVLTLAPFSLMARQQDDSENPIEEIEEQSDGRINIEVPSDILNYIINGSVTAPKPVAPRHQSTSKGRRQGFRIQVFSDGRNQTTLEARARARGNAIVAKFPKYRGQVYSFSKSPNWYTRVGNFATAHEANAALAELKRAFPGFATEMRTVRCEVFIK